MKRILTLMLMAWLFSSNAHAVVCPAFKGNIFLTAVEPIANSTNLNAIFGYENRTEKPIDLSAGGPCNFFLPSSFREGMISRFEPGLHERAFRVKVLATETFLFWFLGNDLQLQINPQTPPQPVKSLPPATVLVPYSQTLAATGWEPNRTWSTRTPLPTGLTLSSDGVLSGIPSSPGQFLIQVLVEDGITSVDGSFTLNVGDGALAVNDVVSTRPPGFSSQFRLVSKVASTISATASCNPNEFVVTGGGACTVPNSNAVLGRIAASQPAANGWTVTCSGGSATAFAVCNLK
jgi:hypothetical protein